MNTRRNLTLAELANSVGDGAFLVTSALYFADIVGLSAPQIGLGLTLGWGAGAVAGVPLGHLADRLGPRRVAVTLALVTALAVAAFLLVSSFAFFALASCLYGVAQTGQTAARQALLAGLVGPSERTRVRAILQSTRNGGLAVGAALGGLALHLGTREAYLAVFVVDAASFLLAALALTRLPAVTAAPRTDGPRLAVLRDRPYAVVTLLNTVMLLYMPLLSLIVPLWIAQRTTAPTWMVSALLVLNTLSVLLLQVRVARRVKGLTDAVRVIRLAGLVMLAACAVFSVSGYGWALLLVAAGLQVAAEMLLSSGAWEIGFGLAPADKQGQYQGFFGTAPAVARMLGPAVLTTLVIGWGTAGWLVVGAMFVTAGAAMAPAVRWAERTRLLEGPQPQAVAHHEHA